MYGFGSRVLVSFGILFFGGVGFRFRVCGPGCLLLGFRKVLQCCVGFRGLGVSRSGSGLPFMWSYRGFQ